MYQGVLAGGDEGEDPAPGVAGPQDSRQASLAPPPLDQADCVELPQVQVETLVLISHINMSANIECWKSGC